MSVKLEDLLQKYKDVVHVAKVVTVEEAGETIIKIHLDVEGYDPVLMEVLLDIEYAITLKSPKFLTFHYITDAEL